MPFFHTRFRTVYACMHKQYSSNNNINPVSPYLPVAIAHIQSLLANDYQKFQYSNKYKNCPCSIQGMKYSLVDNKGT